MTTPPIPDQPRPVVENAHQQTLVVRIIAAVQMVLASLPFGLQAFEMIDWTGEQMIAYSFVLGVLTTAALLIVGQSVTSNALKVEAEVTPVASPQDNDGTSLVPLAEAPVVTVVEVPVDEIEAPEGKP